MKQEPIFWLQAVTGFFNMLCLTFLLISVKDATFTVFDHIHFLSTIVSRAIIVATKYSSMSRE